MDHAQVERLLRQVNADKTDARNQVAEAQDRLNRLTKAAEGLESLLEMTPLRPDRLIVSDPDADHSAGLAAAGAEVFDLGQPSAPADAPKGKEAAKRVLQSDKSRYWTVGQVDTEEVRLGWTEPRPRGGKKRNSPARIALVRLKEEFPDNVDVIETPVLAYRWTDRPSPSLYGSGARHESDADNDRVE